MSKLSRGFTIVELLIAAALLLGLLIAIAQGLRDSGSALGKSVGRGEMVEDIRAAGQMMADMVSSAVYVYPPGSTITLGATGYTFKNPRTDNGTWTVGTDNILAFILPPVDATIACVNTGNSNGCMFFVAYYAVERNTLIAGLSDPNSLESPGVDPKNGSRLLIYEYRRSLGSLLPAITVGTLNGPAPFIAAPSNVSTGTNPGGQLVADYIASDADNALSTTDGINAVGFVVSNRVCRRTDLNPPLTGQPIGQPYLLDSAGRRLAVNSTRSGFSETPGCPSTAPTPLNPFLSIAQATIEIQGKVQRSPNAGDTQITPRMTFPITPRNLY